MSAILFMLLTGAAAPAMAPQKATSSPASSIASPACTAEHAAMGHCKLPPPAPAPNVAKPGKSEPASSTPDNKPAAIMQRAPAPPKASCTPERAAMGHCKLPSSAPSSAGADGRRDENVTRAPQSEPPVGNSPPSAPAVTAQCSAEHAAMGHCTLDPAAQTGADLHAGHSGTPTDPHHGHVMAGSEIPATPPPPEAFHGPANGADLFYNPSAMSAARREMRNHHGGLTAFKFLIDQAEVKIRNGRNAYGWDAQAWYGGDINKLWLKTEGEGSFGEHVETAEVQALWSRAVDPWFDLQLGVRYDLRPRPNRGYLVAGVQGLAPYWFEVSGSVFLSNKGEVSARVEAEYDLRITQQIILQPSVEFDLAAQDVPELGQGSGLSEVSLGARLRHEIYTENGPASIAPYVGIEYERAFGDTAGFRRAAGEKAGGWSLLIGLRTWF